MNLLPDPYATRNGANARYREKQLKDAESVNPSQSCRFWQKRKNRYCPRRPMDGISVCSLHTERALKLARAESYRQQDAYVCKMVLDDIISRIAGECGGPRRKRAKKMRIFVYRELSDSFRTEYSLTLQLL